MADPTSLEVHLKTVLERLGIDPDGPVDDDPTERSAIEDVMEQRRAARRRVLSRVVPERFKSAQLEKLTDLQQQERIASWWGSSSPTLILTGGVGVGKTYAGWAVLQAIADLGVHAYGSTVFDLVAAMRPDAPPSPAPRLAVQADVYLFDDLAAERPTEWVVEQLTAIFDERTREGRRQIVTTNATSRQLGERLGSRIVSRLAGGATVVEFGGVDMRANW